MRDLERGYHAVVVEHNRYGRLRQTHGVKIHERDNSLIAGDGLKLRGSGLIGSILGALVVTAVWLRFDSDKAAEASRARRR